MAARSLWATALYWAVSYTRRMRRSVASVSYTHLGSDLSGWRWNAYTPPALLPLPGDMAALLRPDAPADGLSADPTAVRLAYNFGLALLNNDESRMTELVMGQDAPDLFSLYPDTSPLADLTGFACTGAAVAVDEDGGPALLILDIEAPGKTGLPTGRHAYCLEYRTRRQVDENPNPGPAGDTVSALVPRQLWGPQNTPACLLYTSPTISTTTALTGSAMRPLNTPKNIKEL